MSGFGWSPDGSRFAYEDATDAALHITDEPLGTAGLAVTGVGGENLVWSPAGDRVLLASSFGASVSVVDLDGVVTELDTNGHDGSWSSDGAWVGWTSPEGIEMAHPDGSGAGVIAAAPANGVLWRPASHQLLILAPSFLIADADTGVLTPFTVDPIDFAQGVRWSPDGNRLAWSASADGVAPPRIWVDSFDGSGALAVSPLVPSDSDPAIPNPFTSPFWSPDGTELAVAESQGPWMDGFTVGSLRVRLVPADGSGPGLPLTEFPAPVNFQSVNQLREVTWSPDRRWIAVEIQNFTVVGSSGATTFGFLIISVDGSSVRSLGGSFRLRGHVEWWPVVGVEAADGTCVVAAQQTEPTETPASTAPATRPQFTG